MKDVDERRAAEQLGVLEVLTLIFSVYVLVALVIQATVKLSPETANILRWIDFFVCAVFLADFFVRFHAAPSKTRFLKWGWIDFVSSLPVNIFQVGRVVRIIRVFRLLRAFKSMKNLLTFFFQCRKFTLFAAVAASSLCVMVSHQPLQPRTSRIKTAVPISEITIEPMQPRRFEKNAKHDLLLRTSAPID